MIHTFELSKELSPESYMELRNNLHGLTPVRNKPYMYTMSYSDRGVTLVTLCKFKRKENDALISISEYHYMVTFSVNVGVMFPGDGNGIYSNNINSFGEAFIKNIYYNIYEIVPSLEIRKDLRNAPTPEEREYWYQLNTFKARRIDYNFDFKSNTDAYLYILKHGYSVPRFNRYYYQSEDIVDYLEDDEYDYNSDDFLATDPKYIYYKNKSVNLNIYNKAYALEKCSSIDNPTDYDFLRIECQAKKSKLNAIVRKFHLQGRDLRYLATPEVESYVLSTYTKALVGTGIHYSLNTARALIDASNNFKPSKKERLKRLLYHISKRFGIANTLDLVEKQKITDLGKLSTVKQYLKDIESLGISPITLSNNTVIDKSIFKNGLPEGCDPLLPNLTSILASFNNDIAFEHEHGQDINGVEL